MKKRVQTKKQAAVQKGVPAQGNTRGAASAGARTVRTVPAKQIAKISVQKGTEVAVTDRLFAGARFIEITGNGISVTHTASRSQKGAKQRIEVRKHVPQNEATLAEVNKLLNEANRTGKVKKVRIEFKK